MLGSMDIELEGLVSEPKRLEKDIVSLNITLLIISTLLCHLGYTFIFIKMKKTGRSAVRRMEKYWSVSLGISDITAASITVPIYISGLLIQEDFLPREVCYLAGFVDNLYLVSSVWSIVLWSVCRLFCLTHPLSSRHVLLTRLCVAGVWVGAVVVAALPLPLSAPYQFSQHSLTCSSNSVDFNLALGVVGIVVPLVVVGITFSLTLHIARQRDTGKTGIAIENRAARHHSHRKNNLFSTRFSDRSRKSGRIKHWTKTSSIKAADRLSLRAENKYQSSCQTIPETIDISPQPPNEDIDVVTAARNKKRGSFSTKPTQVEKRKKHQFRGSRRAQLVLSCLFLTQVMSTLPVFLLFLLVYYSKNTDLIPSIQSTTLLTTLLVSNTGLNPVIRIILRPEYNVSILAALSKVCFVCGSYC